MTSVSSILFYNQLEHVTNMFESAYLVHCLIPGLLKERVAHELTEFEVSLGGTLLRLEHVIMMFGSHFEILFKIHLGFTYTISQRFRCSHITFATCLDDKN